MTRSETKRYAVGADIGGSHICSAVIDLQQGELCTEPISTPVDCTGQAVEILDAWADNIHQSICASGLPVSQIGMAFPGPFDYPKGISLINGVCKFDHIYALRVSDSLRGWMSLSDEVDFRFVNDASAFALGECLGGAARDAERVVALTLGTGVGSGFVSEHKLVVSGSEVPANGWVYCLPFEQGIADDAFSTRWICRRYEQLTGQQIDGARQAAERYDHDPAAQQLFEEYGQRLAAFAGPLLERFGSNTLLLGGNISRAYPLFGQAMTRQFAAENRKIDLRISTLLDRAALIGAASLFI